MKNIRSYGKKTAIRELARVFDKELDAYLPVAVMPDCSVVVKRFQVKQQKDQSWAVISIDSKDIVDSFFLKSCALLAAKARYKSNFTLLLEVKRLDRQYAAHSTGVRVFEHSITQPENQDRLEILTMRLEHDRTQLELYRDKIQSMFRIHFA